MGKKKGKGPAPPRSNPVSESESGNPSPGIPVAATSATTAPPATNVTTTSAATNLPSPSVSIAANATPAMPTNAASSPVSTVTSPLPSVGTVAPTSVINATSSPASKIAATAPHSPIAASASTTATKSPAAAPLTAIITTTAAPPAAIVTPTTVGAPIPAIQMSSKPTDIAAKPTPTSTTPLTDLSSKTEEERVTQKTSSPQNVKKIQKEELPDSGATVLKQPETEKSVEAIQKSSPMPAKGDISSKQMPSIQNLNMPPANNEKSIKETDSPPKNVESPSQKVVSPLKQGALPVEQQIKPVPLTQSIPATAPAESLQQKTVLAQKIETTTPQNAPTPQKIDQSIEKPVLPLAKVELPQQIEESLTQMAGTGLQQASVKPKKEEQTPNIPTVAKKQVESLPKSFITPQDTQTNVEAIKVPITQSNISSQAPIAENISPKKDVTPVKLADIGITRQNEQAVKDPSEKIKANQKPDVPKKPPGLMQAKGPKAPNQQQQVKLDITQEKAKENNENVTLKQEFAAALKSQEVSKNEESIAMKKIQGEQEAKAMQSSFSPPTSKVENYDKLKEKIIPQSQGLLDFMTPTSVENKKEIAKDQNENSGTADIKLKPEVAPQKSNKGTENKIETVKDTKPVAATKEKSGAETAGQTVTDVKKQAAIDASNTNRNESSTQNPTKTQEPQNQKDASSSVSKSQKQAEPTQKENQKLKDEKNKDTVKSVPKTDSMKVTASADKSQKKPEGATKDIMDHSEAQKQTDAPKDNSKAKDESKKTAERKESKKPEGKNNTDINQSTKNEQGEKPHKSEPKKGLDNEKGETVNKKQSTEESKETNNASDKKSDSKAKGESEKEKVNKQKQNVGAQKENKSKDDKSKTEKVVATEKESEEKGKPQKQPQSAQKESTKVKESNEKEKSSNDVGKTQKQTPEKEAKGKSQTDVKNETKAPAEKGKGQSNKKAEAKPQSEKGKEEKPQKLATATKEGKVKEDKASKKVENAPPQKIDGKETNPGLFNKEKAASDTKTEQKPQVQPVGILPSEVGSETPAEGTAVETTAAKKKRRRKKKKPAEFGVQNTQAASSDSKPSSETKPAQPKPTQGTKAPEQPKTANTKGAVPSDNAASKPPGGVTTDGIGETTESTQTKKKKNKKKKKQGSSGCETVTGTSNAGNETAVPLKPKYAVHRLAHHLSNCCCVCKSTGNDKYPVLTCSACSLACYCGREHQVQHWPEHKEFCNYISTVISKERPYFFSPAEKMNQDERRHFKLSELQLCQKALNRTLTPLESALILHPRACFTCYKPVFQNVCTKCYCINYCCSEHLPSDHKNWCDILRIKLLFVQSQKEHGSSGVNVQRPMNICYPLNSNMKEYLQSLDFICPNNMPKELYYAHISELATYPLSLLHALQLLATQGATNPLQYEHLVVHIVGAEDVYECCQMLKWKYFFVNLLPNLKTLHLVFIGCELSIEDEKVHVEGRLVYEFHAKMTYLDYCKKCYIKPSIVCAFNSGLYRNTGYNGSDSWGPSLVPMLNMNPGAPLLLTAYTHMESQLDVQRLKEIFLNSMQIVQQPLKNPYASIFPNHNLVSEHECPVAFRNYFLTIVRHA